MVAWRLEGYSSTRSAWLLLDERSFYAPTASRGTCPAAPFSIEAPMVECRNCPIGTSAPSGSTRKVDCVCDQTELEIYYELTDTTQLASSDGFTRTLSNYQNEVEFSPVGAIFMSSTNEKLRYKLPSTQYYNINSFLNLNSQTGGSGMTMSVWVKSSKQSSNGVYDWIF